jgi:subtilisin family serine protease
MTRSGRYARGSAEWTSPRYGNQAWGDGVRRAIRVLAVAATTSIMALTAGPAGAVPLPDTGADGQWWFVAWDVAKIWALGAQGQGVTVAVLDTGVNPSVAGLSTVLGPGIDITTNSGDGRTDRDQASTGHGTRMAAFIAGQGGKGGEVGVAPRVKVLPVIVSTGQGDPAALFSAGITWAVDHGAKVISMSQAQFGTAYPDGCPPEVQDAVRDAVGRGAVVVAAAGNEASASNPPMFPAACKGVLSVGAIDLSRHVWEDSERQPYVDAAAPGVHMRGVDQNGARTSTSGTSDSAALTSGAVALVWSKFPQLTNRQVVARLLATLRDDADRPGRDDAAGGGIIRPYTAITQNVPASAPNPVFDELGTLPTATPSGGQAPTTTSPCIPPRDGQAVATVGPGPSGAAPGAAPCSSASSDSGGGLSPAIVVGALAAVVVVLGGVLAWVFAARRRRDAVPPQQAWPPQQGPGWPPAR